MFRFCLFLALVLDCAAICVSAQATPTSQAPQDVSVCELIQNAASFNGHLVRVPGHIDLEFENFTITDRNCGIDFSTNRELSPVWLTYGGDETDPAVYCCGSHERKKGADVEVEGHRLPLVRDAAYQEMRDRLTARRLRRPSGETCYDECNLYRVTASVTGTFFSKPEDSGSFSGFGHLGCCHLLVIQQVASVSTERTKVPIAGEFQCNQDTWTPKPEEVKNLNLMQACPIGGSCDDYVNDGLAQVALHWKDAIDLKDRAILDMMKDTNGSLVTDWLSSDLLTRFVARSKATRNGDMAPDSITRTVCRAVSPDRASKHGGETVSCRSKELSPLQNEELAMEWDALIEKNQFAVATQKFSMIAKQMFSDGDQSWRFLEAKEAASHLLRAQTEKWDILPEAALQFDGCNNRSVDVSESGLIEDCGWYTRDGLQTFGVSVFKYTGSDISSGDRKIPWMVYYINAGICDIQ